MQLWNDICSLEVDLLIAHQNNDRDKIDIDSYKLYSLVENNCSDELKKKIDFPDISIEEGDNPTDAMIKWFTGQNNALVSPFKDEEFKDSYFDDAREKLEESEKALEEGMESKHNAYSYGFVSVLYSVILFMLGIIGTFKNKKCKLALVSISCVAFVVNTIYMFTLPIPNGLF